MDHRARAIALWMCVLVVAALSLPMPADAQADSYDELVVKALAAYQAERWDEARRLFELAHGLQPTARTLRTIGMSAFNQGDYVAALQNLEAALVERRKPLTEEQRAHVHLLIDQANEQVGRFRLRVSPEGSRLMVDGKSPAFSRQGELVLPAGRHEVEVSKAGYPSLIQRLEVQAGDRALLELALPGQEPALADATSADEPKRFPGAGRVREARSKPADTSPRQTWGMVALSTGGATLLASGIITALALKDKSELDDACPDRRCTRSNYDRLDRYDRLRTAAGVTFAVGLLGAGIGGYVLFATEEHAPIQAVLSPSFVGVRGRL